MKSDKEIRDRAILLLRLSSLPYEAGLQWVRDNGESVSGLCGEVMDDPQSESEVNELEPGLWIAENLSDTLSEVYVDADKCEALPKIIDDINRRNWFDGLLRNAETLLWVLGVTRPELQNEVLPPDETPYSVLGLKEPAENATPATLAGA